MGRKYISVLEEIFQLKWKYPKFRYLNSSAREQHMNFENTELKRYNERSRK